MSTFPQVQGSKKLAFSHYLCISINDLMIIANQINKQIFPKMLIR